MERVDPARDLARVAGRLLRPVTLEAYDPAADSHAAGVACRGSRSEVRVAVAAAEGGEVRVRTATWVLVGPRARPTLRSRVVDGPDRWVLDSVTPDPVEGLVYTCEATLA